MTTSPIIPDRAARRSNTRRAGTVGAGALLVTGGAAALIASLAGSAGASTTITVDSNGDGTADATHCTDGTPGNCTLRDAAAAALDGDTITFDPSVTSITLTNNTISFHAITLTGPGSSALTVTTTAAPGLYDTFNFQNIGASRDVVISGLTLTKNRIYVSTTGKLTLDDVSVSGSTGTFGGALYATNTGDLEITDSHFDSNIAIDQGGAIYAYNTGNVTISGSTFTNNSAPGKYAGAIDIRSTVTDATITGCTITDNSADYGGGIYTNNAGDLVISDSTIASNSSTSSGGGAYINTFGTVDISTTTFDSNSAATFGGGLYLSRASDATTIISSTFSDNTANSGGALSIASSEPVVIANSTMSGNIAVSNAGALYGGPNVDLTLDQVTIATNTAGGAGGGIFASGSIILSGSIVSANTASILPGSDLDGATGSVDTTNSIIGTFGALVHTDNGGTIISSVPGVLPLADNGGPTRTMALDPTSIAIDAGPDPVATFTGNGFDQRGTPWLRIYNGTADIGAYEEQPDPTPTTTTTEPTTTTTEPTTTTAGTDPVVPAFTG